MFQQPYLYRETSIIHLCQWMAGMEMVCKIGQFFSSSFQLFWKISQKVITVEPLYYRNQRTGINSRIIEVSVLGKSALYGFRFLRNQVNCPLEKGVCKERFHCMVSFSTEKSFPIILLVLNYRLQFDSRGIP